MIFVLNSKDNSKAVSDFLLTTAGREVKIQTTSMYLNMAAMTEVQDCRGTEKVYPEILRG